MIKSYILVRNQCKGDMTFSRLVCQFTVVWNLKPHILLKYTATLIGEKRFTPMDKDGNTNLFFHNFHRPRRPLGGVEV
jgi:hypothetical protein